MNIFYLHNEAKTCAQMHNDKHCVKMILEYSQLLSTAHRVLDGSENVGKSQTGRKKTKWVLNDERDSILYSATHINHPSAIWVRQSDSNYRWLHNLLHELCKEYAYRYGRIHKCESSGLVDVLSTVPNNIVSAEFTEPTPAMPDEFVVAGDSICSYRIYYNKAKQHLASWKGKLNGRNVPDWFLLEVV